MHSRQIRNAVVEARRASSATCAVLGRSYGVPESTVRRWTAGVKKGPPRLNPQELLRLEQEEGMRRIDIAAKFGVSKSAVTKAITRFLGA